MDDGGAARVNAWLFGQVNGFARATPWLHPLVVGYAGCGMVVFAGLLLAGWWSARRADDARRMAAVLCAGARGADGAVVSITAALAVDRGAQPSRRRPRR
jgi:undecaprenyl-diphosphatase